ncbi:MAG: hypothetical protein ACYC5Q_02460 [Thermoleophilia bacterium]
MQNRLFKITASVATIGAMALGGAALANASGPASTVPATPDQAITSTAPAAEQEATVDNDAVEFESESEADDATEVGGVEEAESSELESAAESDGPGGHADEPGDANADHQFEGEE